MLIHFPISPLQDNVIERRGYPGTIHRIACKTQFSNINVIQLDASSRACCFKRVAVASYDRCKFTLLHGVLPSASELCKYKSSRRLARQRFLFPYFSTGLFAAGSFPTRLRCPRNRGTLFES